MRMKGLEPSLPKKLEPKSSASTIPPHPHFAADRCLPNIAKSLAVAIGSFGGVACGTMRLDQTAATEGD
jgi:hypothetical protein